MSPEMIKEKLVSRFGDDTISVQNILDQVVVNVPGQLIVPICEFVRDDPDLKFDFLSFVGAVDRMPESPRFELVYQLYSTSSSERLRIKTRAIENESGEASISSVCGVWGSANWHERETAEMFGIVFDKHPDPRKLLLPDEWNAHPLRKDFPLMGTDQDTPDLSK